VNAPLLSAPAKRRQWLIAGSAILAAPWPTLAQQAGRVYRIAVLLNNRRVRSHDAFVQALQEAGYVEGHNLHIEWRSAESQPERFPALVDDVLRAKVDVIVAGGTSATKAAMKATQTTPIVFLGSLDPVAVGLVTSLARPGGNVTGASLAMSGGFPAKWLQLLKQTVPTVSHVAVLWQASAGAAPQAFVSEMAAAAGALKVRLDHHVAPTPAELGQVLATIGKSNAKALLVTGGPLFTTRREQLIALVAGKRMPAISFEAPFAEAGGLMSYCPSTIDLARRAAALVDKILKGAKAGDLPVEEPTNFELVINLKAAHALGLTIPKSVLVGANRVIE
jgi:putative tryptophan/tyrosine transport system substrate-binding protein